MCNIFVTENDLEGRHNADFTTVSLNQQVYFIFVAHPGLLTFKHLNLLDIWVFQLKPVIPNNLFLFVIQNKLSLQEANVH